MKFIKANRAFFEPFIVGEGYVFENYMKMMSLDHSWGGAIEMQAMSLQYSRNFCIYSFSSPEPHIIDNGFKNSFCLWYSHGMHYDYVVPKHRMKKITDCQDIVYRIANVVVGLQPSDNTEPIFKNIDFLFWKKSVQEQEAQDLNIAQKYAHPRRSLQ